MKACAVAMESTCQSSVEALPRRFGRDRESVAPLPFTAVERDLARFDGGSEVDALREEREAGAELSEKQEMFLHIEDAEERRRPLFPLRDGHGQPLPAGAKRPPRP